MLSIENGESSLNYYTYYYPVRVNQRLLGNGVMVSIGKDHAKHRSMILPTAFSADSITGTTTTEYSKIITFV